MSIFLSDTCHLVNIKYLFDANCGIKQGEGEREFDFPVKTNFLKLLVVWVISDGWTVTLAQYKECSSLKPACLSDRAAKLIPIMN